MVAPGTFSSPQTSGLPVVSRISAVSPRLASISRRRVAFLRMFSRSAATFGMASSSTSSVTTARWLAVTHASTFCLRPAGGAACRVEPRAEHAASAMAAAGESSRHHWFRLIL